MEKKDLLRQFQINQLKNGTDNVIHDKTLSEGFKAPVKNVTEHINTKGAQQVLSGPDFTQKIAAMRAAKAGGKKLLGALPFVGAGIAALNGDSAMAAEELAGDVPVAGQVFEAIKPTTSGPEVGSFDDRLERGTLTDEDKLLLRQQALQSLR